MARVEQFTKNGIPILGQTYEVPIDTKDEWLRELNELKSISARIVEDDEPAEGMTNIFVFMSFMYDKPRDTQARMGLPDPRSVTQRINETMHHVATKLNRSKSLEKQ